MSMTLPALNGQFDSGGSQSGFPPRFPPKPQFSAPISGYKIAKLQYWRGV